MSYDFDEFRRLSQQVGKEHRDAIDAAEDSGRQLAKADAEYHRALAVEVAGCKQEFGATVAETMAKGSSRVREAKEARDAAAARDRAAMERIRLARDDRASLLTLGAWSKAQEMAET